MDEGGDEGLGGKGTAMKSEGIGDRGTEMGLVERKEDRLRGIRDRKVMISNGQTD